MCNADIYHGLVTHGHTYACYTTYVCTNVPATCVHIRAHATAHTICIGGMSMSACGLNIITSSADRPKDATFVMTVMIIMGGVETEVEPGKLYLKGWDLQ